MQKTMLLLTMLMLSAGCATSRPKIVVGNASEVSMGDILVVAGDTVLYHEDYINPRSSGRSVELPQTYDGSAKVRWRTRQKGAFEDVVAIEPLSPEMFDGTIYIQLKDSAATQVFFLSDKEAKQNVLPWSTPQEWEGTPGIPGLNQQR